MAEFVCPNRKTVFESSAFTHKHSRHVSCVKDHYFNHAVEICFPCCDLLPHAIQTSSPDLQDYLVIKQLPLAELTNANFIEKFVKTGRLYILSTGQNIDTHNVVAILPTGRLVLSVNKDTYQELGLEGKPSQFEKPRKVTKYCVEVNLVGESFCKGKRSYERVQWCFKERLDLTFDFLMAWQPNDQDQSLDLLSSFWSNKYECRRARQRHDHFQMRNQCVPVIDSSRLFPHQYKPTQDPSLTNGSSQGDSADEVRSCDASEVYEWLGAVACQCNCTGTSDDFVNTYQCPEPSQVSSAVYHRWSGLITSETILHMLDVLRLEVQCRHVPWAALTVHGFADSPVSWVNREHGFHKYGNNLYTFVIFPKEQRYWLVIGIGDHDVCP
ncbi:ribonuclease P protein subunit p40-like isoform X1 [Acanthaster planci]|uniref:Ribonuclease P protein subunit p40-like isoform X1 n=1 Tax=Acanthaster planci TaxID=133434 RepID=A0A8B7ZVB3_ACAPL|nr:ribonuclease P protein subunit p40-like isoform X1 [Acanthaster planci]